jgi:hypothetical protein
MYDASGWLSFFTAFGLDALLVGGANSPQCAWIKSCLRSIEYACTSVYSIHICTYIVCIYMYVHI